MKEEFDPGKRGQREKRIMKVREQQKGREWPVPTSTVHGTVLGWNCSQGDWSWKKKPPGKESPGKGREGIHSTDAFQESRPWFGAMGQLR